MRPTIKLKSSKWGEKLLLEYKAKRSESKTRTVETPKIHFDVGKHIHFVPPFQEFEVDKYFMHFEHVATT